MSSAASASSMSSATASSSTSQSLVSQKLREQVAAKKAADARKKYVVEAADERKDRLSAIVTEGLKALEARVEAMGADTEWHPTKWRLDGFFNADGKFPHIFCLVEFDTGDDVEYGCFCVEIRDNWKKTLPTDIATEQYSCEPMETFMLDFLREDLNEIIKKLPKVDTVVATATSAAATTTAVAVTASA